MLDVLTTFVDQTKRVEKAAEEAGFRNFGHAAAGIRKTAQASIVDAPGPSPPGTPPHTHTAKKTKSGKTRAGQLPRSITFNATKEDAIVGPRFSVVGPAGEAHEFGGEFRSDDYDERAFMGPALDENRDRFAESWEGSIGQ